MRILMIFRKPEIQVVKMKYIRKLAALANRLDSVGLTSEANFLDAIIYKSADEQRSFGGDPNNTPDAKGQLWPVPAGTKYIRDGKHFEGSQLVEHKRGEERADVGVQDVTCHSIRDPREKELCKSFSALGKRTTVPKPTQDAFDKDKALPAADLSKIGASTIEQMWRILTLRAMEAKTSESMQGVGAEIVRDIDRSSRSTRYGESVSRILDRFMFLSNGSGPGDRGFPEGADGKIGKTGAGSSEETVSTQGLPDWKGRLGADVGADGKPTPNYIKAQYAYWKGGKYKKYLYAWSPFTVEKPDGREKFHIQEGQEAEDYWLDGENENWMALNGRRLKIGLKERWEEARVKAATTCYSDDAKCNSWATAANGWESL